MTQPHDDQNKTNNSDNNLNADHTDHKSAQPQVTEKRASHFEGFLLQARNSGLTDKEAADIYSRFFNN